MVIILWGDGCNHAQSFTNAGVTIIAASKVQSHSSDGKRQVINQRGQLHLRGESVRRIWAMILLPVREACKNIKLGPSFKSETTRMHKINRFRAATFYGAILDVLVVQEILKKGSVCFAKRGQHIVVHSKILPVRSPQDMCQVCVELRTLSNLGF